MSGLAIKASLLITLLFESLSIYGFISFYPGIAQSQGISTWIIGTVISLTPIVSFFFSPFVPKLMEHFGRKRIIIAAALATSLGNIFLAIVPYTNVTTAIILSFLARIAIGVGYAFGLISSYATLTSDFPEEVTKLVAWIEIAFSIGSIVGPSVGSVMFSALGYFYSCLGFSIITFITIPILALTLGELREYKIMSENPISLCELFIRKEIFLASLMQFSAFFCFGFLSFVIEYHLKNYGVDLSQIGIYYSIFPLSYLLASFSVSFVPDSWNKPKIMLIGTVLMAFGFAMAGPLEYIFPKKLIIVCFGLFLLGLSQAIMFVIAMPHMLDVSVNCYGYAKDDRLNDALSGLTNANLCLGEAVGPIVGSLLSIALDVSNICNIFCLSYIVIAVIYGVFSDAFRKTKKYRHFN